MSITPYNGWKSNPVELRPWSAPGIMSTEMSKILTALDWAIARRSVIDVSLYRDSSGTISPYFYLPPLPNHCGWAVRFSRTSDSGNFYESVGGTSYSVTKNSSGWTKLSNRSVKYTTLYFATTTGANWGSSNPIRIVIRPEQLSDEVTGYSSSFFSKPGMSNSIASLENSFPFFSHSVPTGLSSAHYNTLIDAAKKALEIPVLHAASASLAGYDSFTEWTALIPLCVSPDSPPAQRIFTIVFRTPSTPPEALKVEIGNVALEAPRTFYTNNLAEYRIDLTDAIALVPPTLSQHGRSFYYAKLSLFPSKKSSAAIYSWSAWTGIPEGGLS